MFASYSNPDDNIRNIAGGVSMYVTAVAATLDQVDRLPLEDRTTTRLAEFLRTAVEELVKQGGDPRSRKSDHSLVYL